MAKWLITVYDKHDACLYVQSFETKTASAQEAAKRAIAILNEQEGAYYTLEENVNQTVSLFVDIVFDGPVDEDVVATNVHAIMHRALMSGSLVENATKDLDITARSVKVTVED